MIKCELDSTGSGYSTMVGFLDLQNCRTFNGQLRKDTVPWK